MQKIFWLDCHCFQIREVEHNIWVKTSPLMFDLQTLCRDITNDLFGVLDETDLKGGNLTIY